MFSQNDEDKKLNWMYKGGKTIVDREDYLLGRSVDKALEELIAKEKQGGNPVTQPKNHVEHECIPPSIRDFKKLQLGDQVDLAQKLQEDPLIAIKKREEETRQKLLQNPVQLKKIQKIIKSRNDEKDDNQLSSSMSTKLITALLQSHVKITSQVGTGTVSVEDSLDVLIAKKIISIMKRFSEVDLDVILNMFSDVDDTDDEKETRKKNSKSGERNNTEKKKSRKHREVKRDESSELEFQRKQKNYKTEVEKRKYRRNSERSDSETEKMRKRRKTGYRESSPESNDERNKKNKKNHRESTRKYSQLSSRKKTHSSSGNSSDSSEKTDVSSDEDRKKSKRKHYGLVRPDGTKIHQSKNKKLMEENISKEKPKVETAVKQQARSEHKKRLSEEELEKRRKEMLQNAEWRDTERAKNVRKYKDEDLKDSKVQEYSAEFMKKELLKSANNSTVESRIKANINNIQRSGRDMNTHFSRR